MSMSEQWEKIKINPELMKEYSEQWEKIKSNPELMKEYNAKLAYHGGYVESKSNTLNCIDRTSFYDSGIITVNFNYNKNVGRMEKII